MKQLPLLAAFAFILTSVSHTQPRETPKPEAQRNFSINGIPLAPVKKTIELGKRIVDDRTMATVEAIRKTIGK